MHGLKCCDIEHQNVIFLTNYYRYYYFNVLTIFITQ